MTSAHAPGPARNSSYSWLERLHAIVVVLLILNVLGIVGGLLMTVATGLPNREMVDYGSPPLLVPAVDVALNGAFTSGTRAVDVNVEVSAYNGRLAPLIAVLRLFTWLPGALTGLLALWWLRRITEHHHDDHRLFSMASVGYLRRIGATLLIGSVASAVLAWTARTLAGHLLIANSYPFQPIRTESGFWILFIVGFAALAVAEVLRRGLIMREELEGTV